MKIIFLLLSVLAANNTFSQKQNPGFARVCDTLGVNDTYIFELKNITLDSSFQFCFYLEKLNRDNTFGSQWYPVILAKYWNLRTPAAGGPLDEDSKLRINNKSFVLTTTQMVAEGYVSGIEQGEYNFYILKKNYGDTIVFLQKTFFIKQLPGNDCCSASQVEAKNLHYYLGKKLPSNDDEFAYQYLALKAGQQDRINGFGKSVVFDTVSCRKFLHHINHLKIKSTGSNRNAYSIIDIKEITFIDDHGKTMLRNKAHNMNTLIKELKNKVKQKTGVAAVMLYPVVLNNTSGLVINIKPALYIVQ